MYGGYCKFVDGCTKPCELERNHKKYKAKSKKKLERYDKSIRRLKY
jgi:hypothetical protein